MNNQKKMEWKQIMTWALILLIAPVLFQFIMGDFSKHNVEDVKAKMKNYFYQKYGEEFVVNRIGTRSSRGQVFYQARIYPKSIIGTDKQWDDYYYASASVDKLLFGRLGGVGDSYSYVNRNIDTEKYLIPKVKKIFGDRVLLKVDVEHKVTGDGSWWAGYKSKSLDEMRKKVKNAPEHNRIELDLDVYIFNRIDDKKEKEKRRQQIFDFVQYLKDEGLFEYLEMRIVFVDERVLADNYDDFEQKIRVSNKVRKHIEDEDVTVKLPPMELRKKMSRQLQKQVNKMSEEDSLNNMQKIDKDELTYKGIRKWNSQHQVLIYSEGILKERYNHDSNYERIKDYDDISDISIEDNLEYAYIN